jgi:hypothetical protein
LVRLRRLVAGLIFAVAGGALLAFLDAGYWIPVWIAVCSIVTTLLITVVRTREPVPDPAHAAVPPGAPPGEAEVAERFGFSLLSDHELTGLAGSFADSLLYGHAWIHRRVLKVEFQTARSYRSQTSIDFTVPTPTGPATEGVPSLLPLQLIGKGSERLKRLDLRDEAGHAVPVLLTGENHRLAKAALATLYSTASMSTELEAGTIELIEGLVTARQSCGSEHDCRDAQPCAGRLREELLEGLDRVQFDSNDAGENDAAAKADLAAKAFIALSMDFADNYVLTAVLLALPGSRRIVKLSYDIEARQGRRPRRHTWRSPDASFASLRRGIDSGVRRLIASLGLSPLTFIVPAHDIAAAQSYHVEVPSPDGLFIEAAAISVRQATGAWHPLSEPEARSGVTDRLHLYAPRQPRGLLGQTEVRFRMDSVAWPGLAGFAAILTAAFLGGGLLLHLFWGKHSPAGGATSLLLLLPGLLVGQAFRPGEHPVLRWVARGMRFVALVIVTLSVAAAALLAVPPVPLWLWCSLTGVSLLTLIPLAIVANGSRRSHYPSDPPILRP